MLYGEKSTWLTLLAVVKIKHSFYKYLRNRHGLGSQKAASAFALVELVLVGILMKSCKKRNKTMQLPLIKDSPETRC